MTRDSRARGVWIFVLSFLVARVAVPATTYTDRTAFENAVAGAIGLESFDAEVADGIDFSSISSSRGVEISADWDGSGPQSFVLWDQLATSNGFFGVVGTSSFTEITLLANGTGDNDFFGADNIAFALPEGVFADGFESGNLSSWSGTAP